MSVRFRLAPLGLAVTIAALPVLAGAETHKVRFGWCTPATSIPVAPLAAAKKFGWLEEEGIDLEIVNIATGNECAQYVATGEVDFAAPGIEASAALAARGADLKVFFTIQHASPYSVQVPLDSSIQSLEDLKGKKIGVFSQGALGATIIKGLARSAGLDADADISLIAVGDAQRATHFLQTGELDAVSIFSLAHIQISNLGVPLREIAATAKGEAPSIALVTTAEHLAEHRDDAVGLARAYAKGLALTFIAPDVAEEVFYEVFPESKPQDPVVAEQIHQTNIAYFDLDAQAPSPINAGLEQWGESRLPVYAGYIGKLRDWGIVNGDLTAETLIDNSLLQDINAFDLEEVRKAAASYRGN